MFEKLTYFQLQEYWWFILSLLAALFVFMTFVQGGQSLLYSIAKNEEEKDLVINALGRKWELGFTSLVVFGGAAFAAFPLFYATSFSGAYYIWMAILFCFIIQAVAYEYRKKPNNVFGQKTYEIFLLINGSLGIILLGVALATLFSGGYFIIDNMNLSHWTKNTYGLEALLNPFNIAFGFMLFFLARILAALFFINSIDNEHIIKRAKIVLKYESIIFLILFAYVAFTIFSGVGYAYDPVSKNVYKEPLKYLHNLLAMPIVAISLAIGVILLLTGIVLGLKSSAKGFYLSGIGVVLVVLSLFLILGYNYTAYYPSLANMQSSLTIENSSGSRYTLIAMSYVSLMVPFVLAYIIWAWKAMTSKKITVDEIKKDSHHY